MDTILINDNIKKFYNKLIDLKTTQEFEITPSSNNSMLIVVILLIVAYLIITYYNENTKKNKKTKPVKIFDIEEDENTTSDDNMSYEEKTQLISLIDELSLKNEQDYIKYKTKAMQSLKPKKQTTSNKYLNFNQPSKHKSVIGDLVIESPFI